MWTTFYRRAWRHARTCITPTTSVEFIIIHSPDQTRACVTKAQIPDYYYIYQQPMHILVNIVALLGAIFVSVLIQPACQPSANEPEPRADLPQHGNTKERLTRYLKTSAFLSATEYTIHGHGWC